MSNFATLYFKGYRIQLCMDGLYRVSKGQTLICTCKSVAEAETQINLIAA